MWGDVAVVPTGEIVRRGGAEQLLYRERDNFVPLIGRVRGLAVGLDAARNVRVRRLTDQRLQCPPPRLHARQLHALG